MKRTPYAAIDVALLPPENIAETARQINRALRTEHPEGFALDDTHLPHLTLVQQYILTADLLDVFTNVDTVLASFKPVILTVTGIAGASFGGISVPFMVLQQDSELQRLHEELLDRLLPFSQDVRTAAAFMRDRGEIIRPTSIAYVADFTSRSARKNFDPHITLGVGDAPDLETPLTGSASVVAVCHLGNFNTCRRILRSWMLSRG
ncbi:MAG: 2'-5' RNA ligase family protein [Candidatus Kerfeldbacteria bacterium]|nr:2'-5' RNA ligase family protein [Candidatus Kerfeldbacteria bacterium]